MNDNRRIITNPIFKELGTLKNSSRVLVINTNGEVVNSGLTLQDIMAGIPDLNSDDITEGDVHLFMNQNEKDKLAFIIVSENVDLDWLNEQVRDVYDADLAQYFLNQFN